MKSHLPIENPFPQEEFETRLSNVYATMEAEALDALLVTTSDNVYYLTGYRTFGSASSFLVLRPGEQPLFILRELEAPLLGITSRFRQFRTYSDDEDPLDLVLDLFRTLWTAGTVGLEMSWTSLTGDAIRRLRSESSLNFKNASGVVERHRLIKSPREIEMCQKAADLTGIGMRAAFESVEVGATENDIAAAAFGSLTQAGSEWLAVNPIVTSGPRSGIPHTNYASRTLEPGDTILIELGATHHRYHSPLMRTCVLGTPQTTVIEMYRAARDGLEAALENIKPGITSAEAHAACQRVIDRAGFRDNFKKRLGYSVGIGFRSWMEAHIMALRPGDDRRLETGMVFHLPPALRQSQQFGVGVSETIVVTEGGCEVLGEIDRDLVVKETG